MENFEVITIFVLVAVFAEMAWENVKEALPFEPSSQVDRAVIIALCVLITVSARLDLAAEYGLILPSVVGQVLSGLVISRGANFIHDIMKRVKGSNQ